MEDFRQQYWQRMLTTFDDGLFDAFIKSTALEIQDNTIYLYPPNSAIERWLRENVEKRLFNLGKELLNREFTIRYRSGQAPAAATAETAAPASSLSSPSAPETAVAPPYERTANKGAGGGNSKHLFANFIPGRANEIPLLAAKEIARGNSSTNPLFIYGSTGLGKTHLIQAIGNEYQKNFPNRRVRYITARTFLNEVVRAFRLNQHETFKQRYQNLDLLIVDDIQYIGGDKVRTQEEFFFLFNALYEENKSIVISSDRAPMQMKDMPQRLTTRFSAGLPTHITPPEYELRMEIVRQKARQRGLEMAEEDCVRYIAEHVKANVRELEGAINRIYAMAQFQKTTVSLTLCRKAIADLIGQAAVLVHPDLIKEKVAHAYYINIADLSSQKRHRSIALPRHVAIYLCRQMTTLSLPEIGKHFGKRNHTTVLHSCRCIEEKIKNDAALWDKIKAIEISIKE